MLQVRKFESQPPMFVIERGVPIPNLERKKRGSELRDFLISVPVNHSFKLPDYKIAPQIYQYAKELGYKFTIRKVATQQWRAWRVA